MRGAKRATSSKTNPQDGIMQFGREGKGGRFSYQEELEFSSTVEPAQELEVGTDCTLHWCVGSISRNRMEWNGSGKYKLK